jgi:hypothetical protein
VHLLAIPAQRHRLALPAGAYAGTRELPRPLAWRATVAARAARLEWALLHFNWQPLLIPLSIMGTLGLAAIWLMPGQGYDAYAYWAVDPLHPYGTTEDFGAFLYTPPMALLMAPLGALPFQVAYLLWLALGVAALWYVFGRWAIAAILFPPVFADLAFGNVHVLYAAMIVAAWRRPGLWAFAVLTKLTPGVGLVWHGVRGEWKSLATILAVLLVALSVSLAIQGPGVWASWIEMLDARQVHVSPTAVPIPLVPRLLAAVALVAWGARTGRRWTVPVALCLAIPTWYWSGLMLAPMVALAALWQERRAAVLAR